MKLAVIVLLPLLAATQRATAAQPADLSRIEAEPNPEKRSHAALDNADEALRQAKDAYAKGERAEAASRLGEVEESVNLADRSLKTSGKNPSRSPKHFKAAELKTRDLLRKLDGFRDQMSVADRPDLDRVAAAVQKVHDGLLEGIMGKRK